ncbi:MAG: PaaI family thioesterase [Acidobacteria bacterium]|nr:PaaI family thioesterase [Acidobacteriota bacterium]
MRQTLNELIARMPFNRLLGLRVARTHRDGITIECTLREELHNMAGVLHGGVTATLADAAVGMAIHHHFKGVRRATTVEMKINYFLPIDHGKVRARAHLIRTGSTLCVGRVDIFDARKRLAGAALVTYMLLPNA